MDIKKRYQLIWFQHLHKSAGTLIVNMAIENKEILFDNHNNGNPVDANGILLPIWEYNDDKLLNFINKCEEKGVTFVATEYGSPNFELISSDPRVSLITCIRDPKDRLISNYNYDYYSGYTEEDDVEKYLEAPNPYISDNYYVRVFSRNNSIPLKELKSEDFGIAMSNISRFDIIIKTDDKNLEEKLSNSLDWNKTSDNHHSTYGDKWKIINMVKKLQFRKIIRYIRRKNMVLDDSILDNKFDLDYKLMAMISD